VIDSPILSPLTSVSTFVSHLSTDSQIPSFPI